MPHLLVIFTSRKITKATIMNRINATRKSPTRAHGALAKRMLRNYGKRRRKMEKPSQGHTKKDGKFKLFDSPSFADFH